MSRRLVNAWGSPLVVCAPSFLMSEPTAPPVESPAPESAPAPAPVPLDQAPLSEYVARRGKGEVAAAAPVAEEAEPQGDLEPDGDLPQNGEKPPVGKGKQNFKSRFDQIYRQRSDAMRGLETANARIVSLEAELGQYRKPQESQQPAQPAQPAPDPEKGPALDEWLGAGKTYEDWLDARNDWRISRALNGGNTSKSRIHMKSAGALSRCPTG